MSDDGALFDKGLPIRRAVPGAAHADRSLDGADRPNMALQRAAPASGRGGPGASRRWIPATAPSSTSPCWPRSDARTN
jgi:hypothetical protein